MKKLLRLESEHNGYLEALNASDIKKASDAQLEQVESMLLNVNRLKGLLSWLEQGEKIK